VSAEDDVREEALAGWDASAEAWGRLADRWEEVARPVTDRMLDLAELVPGAQVLELGAGAGEVGRRAAERVVPGGLVVVSDPAPKMVEQIRARIEGVDGAEAAEENAEWIDRPTASFDAALSRWGLMFPLDLDAAFRECRRVLKPGGRLVFATWTTPDENPWMSSLVQELLDQGLIDPPDADADAPGPFRLGDPARVQTLVADAGFVEAHSEPLSFTARYAGLDDYWDSQLQLSSRAREALALTNERGVEALREGLAERFAPYATEGGALEIPARALITVASA
jgi:SAM-dependent methyltransferase